MNDLRFELFGFPVSILPSVLVVAGILFLFDLQGGNTAALADTGVFLGVAFFSVLVHELGHAFVARGYQLEPIDITLHGFGGLTRHRVASRPTHSLLISLAGPAAGIALGILALGVSLATDLPPGPGADVLGYFVRINLIWSLFNLLPVWPLDGGQAFGSVLAMVAPRRAAWVTHGLGLGLGVAVVIAAYTWRFGFVAILAGMLAYQNWQAISALRAGPRR